MGPHYPCGQYQTRIDVGPAVLSNEGRDQQIMGFASLISHMVIGDRSDSVNGTSGVTSTADVPRQGSPLRLRDKSGLSRLRALAGRLLRIQFLRSITVNRRRVCRKAWDCFYRCEAAAGTGPRDISPLWRLIPSRPGSRDRPLCRDESN